MVSKLSQLVPKWCPISYQVVAIGLFGLFNNFDLAAVGRVPTFYVVIEDRCDLKSVRMDGGRSVVGLDSYGGAKKPTLQSFSG